MKLFFLLCLSVAALGQPTAPPAAPWQLVWADEFNIDGPPDPANWTFEHGFVRNRELQWYQPDNARCENGLLIIEGRREKRPNPGYQAGSADWRTSRPTAEYTAASLRTRGRHSWQYGRFEMRGRIDTRAGLWPAFWSLGQDGEWPTNGEIDIMEFYRDTLLANVAWGTQQRFKAEWRTAKKAIASFADPTWSRQFHIWRMDWDEAAISLYVDDQLLNRVPLSEVTSPGETGPHPFRQPHYLLLNLAIGGQQGGRPEETAFPARFEVDYVRVFQRP